MKKHMFRTALLLSTVTLVACGNGEGGASGLETDEEADKGLDIIGETLQFDPNKLVNDGETIELEWWMWDASEIYQQAIDDYMEIYPNVSIEIVNQPWDDMWTRLPLALDGDGGPALFNIHNSHHYNLIDYIEPYDMDIDELSADFLNVEAHLIDDQVHYIDYGMMTGMIFYNADHWEEAGLTEEDYPETWDELIEIALELTIIEGDSIERSGFNINDNHHNFLMALGYQKGEFLFDEDGTSALINTEVKQEAFQEMLDLYEEDQVGHQDFGSVAGESFGQGTTSMVYEWGHFNGELLNEYPDINYGVFDLPSYDGNPMAYDRFNGETTPAINNNLEGGEMEVAQDFIRFFLTHTDVQRDLAINYSVFPTNIALEDDEEILGHPALEAVSETIDDRLWPGPMPATIENNLRTASEDILFNNVDIESALQDAENRINDDLSGTEFESREELQEGE